MIVVINSYELETENIVKFYPCDILGNFQEQSKYTCIKFKDGFKGIYLCNATELLEKMQKEGEDSETDN